MELEFESEMSCTGIPNRCARKDVEEGRRPKKKKKKKI
jgi:hypothetical protein